MKHNKHFLLLGALMLSLCACTTVSHELPTNNPTNNNGEQNEPSGRVDDNNNTNPSGGNTDTSPKPEDGDNGGTTPTTNSDVPLEDSLLYSHNRLKNADFSFNFSFGDKPTNGKKNTHRSNGENYNNGKGVYTENDDGTYQFDYDFQNGPYQKSDYDFFADREEELNRIRSEALDIVDFATSKISVLDEKISSREYNFILSYDAEEDIISVYRESKFGDRVIDYIELFYNDDGLETVHMEKVNYSNDYGGRFDLYYTPGNYYSYAQYGGGVGPGMQWYSVASKMNNKWRGFHFFFHESNAVICNQGYYDYANNQVLICFMFEEDGHFYEVNDRVTPYRITGEQAHGEALPTDTYSLTRYSSWSDCASYDAENRLIQVPMSMIKTFDSLHIEKMWGSGSNGTLQFNPYFNEEGTYFTLKDGTILDKNVYFNLEYGVARYDNNKNAYVLENGEELSYEEYCATCTVNFAGGQAYINKGQEFYTNYPLYFYAPFDKYSASECFEVTSEFLKAFGLEFVEGVDSKVFETLARIEKYGDIFRGGLFKKVTKQSYDPNYIVAFSRQLLNDSLTRPTILQNYLNSFTEPLSLEDIPPVIGNAGSILPSLTGDIKFKINDDNELEFNDGSISINKTIILHKDEQYTLKVLRNGEVLKGDYFSTETYLEDNMSFTLLETAPKLDLPIEEGKYVYTLRLYRIKANEPLYPASKDYQIGFVEDVNLELTVDSQEKGGEYKYQYTSEATALLLQVTFVDKQAPNIVIDIPSLEGEYFINQFLTLKTLKQHIAVSDNYDEFISVEDIEFYVDGELAKLSNDVKIYTLEGHEVQLVLKDSSGNVNSLDFVVKYEEATLEINLEIPYDEDFDNISRFILGVLNNDFYAGLDYEKIYYFTYFDEDGKHLNKYSGDKMELDTPYVARITIDDVEYSIHFTLVERQTSNGENPQD